MQDWPELARKGLEIPCEAHLNIFPHLEVLLGAYVGIAEPLDHAIRIAKQLANLFVEDVDLVALILLLL